MRQHEIEQLVVAPFCVGKPQFRIAPISSISHSRLGGFFKYSITCGSSPLCRIIASVLREVPQAGL
jgi:hypothetical protein